MTPLLFVLAWTTSSTTTAPVDAIDLVPGALEAGSAAVAAPAAPGAPPAPSLRPAPRLVEPAPDPPPSPVRLGSVVGGLATAGVGVAFATWGLVKTQSARVSFTCSPSCPGTGLWVRMFDSGSLEHVGGIGPALVPLGISLVGGGSATAIGAGWIEDGDDVPWLSIVAGVVISAVAYGVMEALEEGPQI